MFGIKDSEIWDPCPYNEHWNAKFHFDAMVDKWPRNKKIATNWAYSQNGLFIIKACIEAREGCNIISLINCKSTVSATANKISALVCRRRILGSMSFGKHLIGNGDSYSLMYFFQPEFYDELEIEGYKEAFLAEKPYLRVHV